MYKQAADATDSLTVEETEVPHLIALAQECAITTKAEFRVEVILTDGKSKKVKIKMRSINEKASYLSNFTKDFDLVKSLVKKSKLGNMDIAFVLKKSVVSRNFIDKLKSNYNNFYLSDDEFVDIVELFISNENVINQGDFGSKITKPIVVKPISTFESKPSVSSSIPAPQPPPASIRTVTKPKIKSGSLPEKNLPSTPLPPSVRPIPKPQIKSGSVKKSPPPPPPPPSTAPMVSKEIAKKTTVKAPPPPPPPPPSTRAIKNSPNIPLQPRRPNVAAKPPIVSSPVTKKNKGRVPPPPPPPPPRLPKKN